MVFLQAFSKNRSIFVKNSFVLKKQNWVRCMKINVFYSIH